MKKNRPDLIEALKDELPSPTPDQIQYLEKIKKWRGDSEKCNCIIGGPWPEDHICPMHGRPN